MVDDGKQGSQNAGPMRRYVDRDHPESADRIPPLGGPGAWPVREGAPVVALPGEDPTHPERPPAAPVDRKRLVEDPPAHDPPPEVPRSAFGVPLDEEAAAGARVIYERDPKARPSPPPSQPMGEENTDPRYGAVRDLPAALESLSEQWRRLYEAHDRSQRLLEEHEALLERREEELLAHGADVAEEARSWALTPQGTADAHTRPHGAAGGGLREALRNNPALIKYLAGALVAATVMIGALPNVDGEATQALVGALTTVILVAFGISARDSSYGPLTHEKDVAAALRAVPPRQGKETS